MRKKLHAKFEAVAMEEFLGWLQRHKDKSGPEVDDVISICAEVGITGYITGLRDSAEIVRSYSSKNMVEAECMNIANSILAAERQLIKGALK